MCGWIGQNLKETSPSSFLKEGWGKRIGAICVSLKSIIFQPFRVKIGICCHFGLHWKVFGGDVWGNVRTTILVWFGFRVWAWYTLKPKMAWGYAPPFKRNFKWPVERQNWETWMKSLPIAYLVCLRNSAINLRLIQTDSWGKSHTRAISKMWNKWN